MSIDTVEELVLNQENTPGTRRSSLGIHSRTTTHWTLSI